ncbi:N-6 DNA methylase [Ruegeria halocynthiae]|uniref:N-6 DNA methylase n=1 Tax=Ruegeria halocynthiae TaxID=985054 RepID=UPI001C409EA0|nr:N-6 DNA methylase [Ruegeria halocynthiae]
MSLIDREGPWIDIGVDVKGEIYEGLLERNASEVKSSAGQYFTPRPVIETIEKCVDPKIGETVSDPMDVRLDRETIELTCVSTGRLRNVLPPRLSGLFTKQLRVAQNVPETSIYKHVRQDVSHDAKTL